VETLWKIRNNLAPWNLDLSSHTHSGKCWTALSKFLSCSYKTFRSNWQDSVFDLLMWSGSGLS